MRVKELENLKLHAIMSGREYSFSYEKEGKKIRFYTFDLVNNLGAVPKEVYTPGQNHGNNLAYCQGENGEDFVYGKIIPSADGLITDKKGIAPLVKFADASPVLVYDSKKSVLALVHGGWQGASQKIALKTVESMVKDFGAKPEDMTAYIGPSIDPYHYEVGEEVYEAFAGDENRENLFYIDRGSYHLKLAEANASALMESGLREDQIIFDSRSTYDVKDLHSYRRDGEKAGLNALLVMMPEEE